MNQYRWLLFDADDTLFDFGAAQDFSLSRTMLHFGLEPTPERKERFKAINAALWTACDRGETTQEELVIERYVRFMEAEGVEGDPAEWNDFGLNCLADSPLLLPGAEQLCRKLSQQYELCLITNGVPFVQRRRLAASPLERFFGERVFISGEMGCRKPERAYFDRVLSVLGVKPQERWKALVIGDSLTSDIRGAFNARLDSVWFNRKGAAAGTVKPTYEVANFSELEDLLAPALFWRGRGPFILPEE